MPSLPRKLLIVAAVDGLVVSPLLPARSRSPSSASAASLRIDYRSQRISPHAGPTDNHPANSTLEIDGIAGLLTVSPSNAFLIAITGREQVALVRRHPVYVITDIALVPLSSRSEAQAALTRVKTARRRADDSDFNTSSEEDDDRSAVVESDVEDTVAEAADRHVRTSSVGEDVIGRKGAYGRFAEKWFSRRGWAVDRRRAEGMSSADGQDNEPPAKTPSPTPTSVPKDAGFDRPENKSAPMDGAQTATQPETVTDAKVGEAVKEAKADVAHNLTPKLLQTTRLLLAASRGFFFSYDWDITRSWTTLEGGTSSLPLYKQVDPLYFWNRHLQKPFIDSGHCAFVLPLMQGFVGQRTFRAMATPPPLEGSTLEEETPEESAPVRSEMDVLERSSVDLVFTLVSRRSTRRPGLRYLRRGVDDHGHTANTVETEQLLSSPSWDHVFSYVQLRGSIPLYFQQSPYSLKPRPILLLSKAANGAALRQHFKSIRSLYGHVHAVSLVEKTGPESVIGSAYHEHVGALNQDSVPADAVGFSWFDFHKICRGMRFENVSRLFAEIGEVLDGFGYSKIVDGSNGGTEVQRRQGGILRTNCMDCLDRTNVVQSAAARRALAAQLATLNITLDASPSTDWFNILWADNGDAISKQYASSAALKGDFTRTNRRTLAGALTDFSFTVTRYFTNVISDFFTQAAIDFLLGNVTAQVFSDFEAEMVSGDPAVSVRRVRQNAIEVSAKIVVADEREAVLAGWTVLAPRMSVVGGGADEGRTVRGGRMGEVVVLLTERAVYRCEFDWEMEKVSAFERVKLRDIHHIQWGTYITSTLAASHTDPARNVGLVLHYRTSADDIVHVNTRSLRSTFSRAPVSAAAAVLTPSSSRPTTPEPTSPEPPSPQSPTSPTSISSVPPPPARKFWAFKMLPVASSSVEDAAPSSSEPPATERDACRAVVGELQAACVRATAEEEAAARRLQHGAREDEREFEWEPVGVEQRDIIGLAEAKKGTSVLDRVGYSLKKLVWA